MRAFALLVLLWTGCASNGVTRGALIASTAMLAWDGAQTIGWAANGWRSECGTPFRETNPVLGEQPSVQRVEFYFASAIVLNVLAWALTPRKYRTVPAVAVMAIQADSITSNMAAGAGRCGM